MRHLTKSPAFLVLAVTIVAIGIGAAVTVFSAVNAIVLRPIALPAPERLVAIYETNLPRDQPFFSVSVPNYVDWKERAQSWESLAAMDWRPKNLTGDGEPEVIQVKAVTANFVPTLGLSLAQGRNFHDEEDRPGGERVVILSHAFWQRRFGGAPDVIGRPLVLDGESHTVVGILAPGEPLVDDIEIAVPLATDVAQENRTNHYLAVFGRLKPGVTLEQADAELKGIAEQITTTHLPPTEQGWSTRLVPFAQEIVGDSVRTMLYVLLGAVALLLLIACANLSNLLLVRASARAHELAIRTALGASRRRVMCHVLTEGLIVALLGGAAGVLLTWWSVDLLRSSSLPRAAEITLDWRVLLVACTATLLSGLLAGLGPALRASQIRPQQALKGSTPQAGRRSRLRDGLVVAQLATSLVLLVGVALLARSFARLIHVETGFSRDNVLTVSMRPVNEPAAFYERLIERVSTLPDVQGAGVISALPLTAGNTSLNVFPRGESIVPAGDSIQSSWRLVDGGYFVAMQIPVLRGRTFAGLTPDEARRSVVISAKLSRLLWGDADPVGRQLDPGGGGRMLTVIGVVGDVRGINLRDEPLPAFYWSMHRFIHGPMNLVVRTRGEVAPLLAGIRESITAIDASVPVFRVRTLDQVRANHLEVERFTLTLLSGFAVVALLLAALGTYGVVAFGVQQRTREIGVRIAVGATPRDILRLVIFDGSRLVLAGLVLGFAAALAGARSLGALLYETPNMDATSYVVAGIALALIALGACLLPARRATRVDPLAALRAE